MVERIRTIVRFDGSALQDHSMDVGHLAPALLALSEVIKAANTFANADRAGVKVFVNANLEQKCFELNVELALSIWEQAKLLVTDDRVVTIKEIAEWVGIIGGAASAVGGVGYGLFQLIKMIRGRDVESVTVLKLENGNTVVELRIKGENDPIQVLKAVYELYANLAVRKKAVEVLAPLREHGYETLQFYRGQDIFVEFKRADVPQSDGSDLPAVTPQNLHVSKIRAGVKIRKAAYEGSSRWTVVYKKAVEAPINDTKWLHAFQSGEVGAPPGSYLDVEMEESYVTNEVGEIIGEPSYVIEKVIGVQRSAESRFQKELSDLSGL